MNRKVIRIVTQCVSFILLNLNTKYQRDVLCLETYRKYRVFRTLPWILFMVISVIKELFITNSGITKDLGRVRLIDRFTMKARFDAAEH